MAPGQVGLWSGDPACHSHRGHLQFRLDPHLLADQLHRHPEWYFGVDADAVQPCGVRPGDEEVSEWNTHDQSQSGLGL